MELLDEKDQTRNQNLILTGQVEVLNRDIQDIKGEYGDFLKKI
jgi:hypothetical protein